MAYHIDEADRQRLSVYCGLPYNAEIPIEVEEKYWEFKRLWNRGNTGQRVPDATLAGFAMAYKKGAPTKEEIDPTPTAANAGLKFDDLVTLEWRNKTVEGTFKGLSGCRNYCTVVLKDDPQVEEREFKADRVFPLETTLTK